MEEEKDANLMRLPLRSRRKLQDNIKKNITEIRTEWIGFISLNARTSGGSSKQGNEPSRSKKFKECLDYLGNCKLLKTDCLRGSAT
jgi:hypothetical protein